MANSTPNLPSYVSFHGMTRDPFSFEVEADMYYSEPIRKQRLDVLLHLTEYGNEVMVVIGPKGSGKTALLQQYQKNEHDNWKVAPIEVLQGFDERKFLKQLYRQMDLPFRGASYNELMDYMEKHFRQLQENSIVPVILVDNADLLPVTALKKVLEMASLTNDESKPLIRVIMFGTEKIKEQFKQPQLGHLANLPMRSLELPPLSEEQTVHYILHRTLAAKFNGKDIFNEPAILKIYRESFGWPARINEICHDMLSRSVPRKNQASLPSMDEKARNPKQLVAAGIAFVALAAVLVFQQQIGGLVNKASDIVSNITTDIQQPEPETVVNQNNIKPEPVATPEPTTLVEKLKSRDSSYHQVNNETEQRKPKSTTPDTEEVAASELATTPVVTEKPDNSGLNIPHGNNWILSQGPNHYTLQVVAGENIETIDDFIKQHQLRDNIAFYHTLRKDKDWYGLVYGMYENKELAKAAVNQLQPSLKRLNPWIRSLGGIQTDIHKLPADTTSTTAALKERLSKPEPRPQSTTQASGTSKTGVPVTEVNRTEEWIMRQRYNHYTLQLTANENLEAIYQFIDRHKLRDSIALYKTIKQDKPWYVLIYGIYSNKQLAISGISRLPTNLQLVKPSIRKFDDIHRDIRKASS